MLRYNNSKVIFCFLLIFVLFVLAVSINVIADDSKSSSTTNRRRFEESPNLTFDQDFILVDKVFMSAPFKSIPCTPRIAEEPTARFLATMTRNYIPELLDVYLLTSIAGKDSGDSFGLSLSAIGDLNKDEYNDLIIGGPGGFGDVYIFWGSSPYDTTLDVHIQDNYSFGNSVSWAGDVNGDGYGDVIIGASQHGINQSGKAYIYFGGSEIDSIPDVIFSGDHNYQRVGRSVAPLGDINGDGFDDVIVGTQDNETPGEAYIYFGGSPMDSVPDLTLNGENWLDYFGNSVSSAGDVNGDNFPDIIVGNGDNIDNKVYLYFGGSLLDSTPDLAFSGSGSSDFGWNVGSAGDVNNDGYDDVLVSAHWYGDPPGFGKLFIYHGGSDMDNIPDHVITGTTPGTCFGLRFASLGDINSDDFDDIIVSAHCGDLGKAFIFFGGLNMAETDIEANAIITGESLNEWFGYAMSPGNLNADEDLDVAIGAPYYPTGDGLGTGKVYIYSINANTIDVEDDNTGTVGNRFKLLQNYPNPFNSSTTISYSISHSDFVTLKVYNILGREVLTLISEFQRMGTHIVNFDANGLSSGIYFYKLQVSNDLVEAKKMLLIQ